MKIRWTPSSSNATAEKSPGSGVRPRPAPTKSDVSAVRNTWSMNRESRPLVRSRIAASASPAPEVAGQQLVRHLPEEGPGGVTAGHRLFPKLSPLCGSCRIESVCGVDRPPLNATGNSRLEDLPRTAARRRPVISKPVRHDPSQPILPPAAARGSNLWCPRPHRGWVAPCGDREFVSCLGPFQSLARFRRIFVSQ